MLTAALGQNAMLWRTSPIGTELEEVVVDWLRQALGLPEAFDGLLTDTASTSSLIALAAARAGGRARCRAPSVWPGGRTCRALRVYASARGAQLDREGVHDARPRPGRRSSAIPTNDRFEMRPEALEAAIAADRAAGRRPIAIVATVGTTSSTSVDPVAAIADIAEREGLWLHVDAAYAGVVAMLPDRRAPFAGWERADSIVVNPHKWLFTPLDASLLLTRRMAVLREPPSASSRSTCGRSTATAPVRDYNEYTPQLGRRFRALKLWIQLRWFGLEGLRRRIEHHLELAAGVRGAGSTPTRTGSGWRPCRSRRSASAGGRRGSGDERRDARRRQRRDHGRRQPDRRGVPVAHAARRPVHDPRRDRQPADRAAPRRAGVGAPARGGAIAMSPTPEPVTSASSRRPERAARLVRREPRPTAGASCGSAIYRKAIGRPTVDLVRTTVDEALLRRLDRQAIRGGASTHAPDAQRLTPRRKGSIWSAINVANVARRPRGPDATGRDLAAFEARRGCRQDRDLLVRAATPTSLSDDETAASRPCRPPGPTGRSGRRRTGRQ